MPDDDRAITPATKVADLLAQYPELEDVLISMAPPFRKLKNPVLRRSVAKVASLKQAATVVAATVYALAMRDEMMPRKTERPISDQ